MTLCIPSLPSPSPSFIFWFSFHFSRDQNRKSPSTVFFYAETKRELLLRRLDSVACVASFDDGASVDRDRAEGGAGGALAPPLFYKNKNKLNKK